MENLRGNTCKITAQTDKICGNKSKMCKTVKNLRPKNVLFALSLFFKMSKSVDNYIYKYSLNHLNHHRSKWSGFSEKKRPSMVRFGKNLVLYKEYYL